MRWVGVSERALEIMCRHAATREIAPKTPLGTRQLVEAAVAESRADIHASRLVVLHAASLLEKEGAKAAREEISLVKVMVARALQRVLDRAVQALGGLGMTDDTPLAFWYAHERAARIYDGPDEVHLSFVGRHTLRRHGLPTR
jgi:alkylation response protein AidB-like acyl-CoA dehydrogenase